MEQASHLVDLVWGILILLMIAAFARSVSERFNFPLTIMLVLIGMGLSRLIEANPVLFSHVANYQLTPDLILYVFLPTLIFESAFNLDSKQLERNLWPVLTLAVPGLLLSTFIIGSIVWAVTPLDFTVALLLGAILSATDPVAVISLFKQLGAPERLTVLVEGESLFNDATSIVFAGLLVGIVMAGTISSEAIAFGVLDFFAVFLGGIVVGWVLAIIVGWLLGKITGDSFIEITLTTVLAYCSFLIAEEWFHVSGVMATVAAGVTMGNWGRIKISPFIATYMTHFWEYMAFLANALIFLLVGLQINLVMIWGSIGILIWVIFAMLLSRAVVIFGLLPVVGKLPGSDPIGMGYQKVMYWGGLRGAIALAIVFSLPEFEQAELFATVVMGSVLFTLVVQGLSIEKLVKYLGLHQPTVADEFARMEGLKRARQNTLAHAPTLQRGGFFSARIASQLQRQCQQDIASFTQKIQELAQNLLPEQELQILMLRCLAREKSKYYELFSDGHLTESTFRELDHSVSVQMSHVRFKGNMPEDSFGRFSYKQLQRVLIRWLSRVSWLTPLVNKLRIIRTVRDYDIAWGRYQAGGSVLDDLNAMALEYAISEQVSDAITGLWQTWHTQAKMQLDQTAEQFPEFVNAMQERVAKRLLLLEEIEVIEQAVATGQFPAGEAEKRLHHLYHQLYQQRGYVEVGLKTSPEELLRKVPFFKETPTEEFALLATKLKGHTFPKGEEIIKQGDMGDSLYLIARGMVKVVITNDKGYSVELATLMAGDFFGEIALLHKTKRTATVKAVTPCSLYELNCKDLDELSDRCPAFREALEIADQQRLSDLSDDM